MQIDSAGNVGIGTTTPKTALHILSAGASGASFPASSNYGLIVENNGSSNSNFVFQTATVGGGNSFNVTNAGNVGVGTTSPAYKLDIAGDVNVTGAFRVNGTSIGAGSSLTGVTNGATAYSTFLGISAGTGLTSGTYNTFVGYNSGASITTGSYNTALGAQAMQAETIKGAVTAIGQAALRDSTGGNNTAVGAGAMKTSTSGEYNAVVGSNALANNSTGNNNVALGDYALNSSSTGNYNTAVGQAAGATNISGAQNVFVGQGAGYNNTGSGNLFLGYQAGYNETGSNKLYIANSNTSTPLIYGDFSAGNVGIGQTSPSGKLDVNQTTAGSIALQGENAGTTFWKVVNPAGGATNTWNAANAIEYVGKDTGTNRSINAAGTVNASGADFAEWVDWTGRTKPEMGSVILYRGSYVVVSSPFTAAFVGNDIKDPDHAILVAFAGQLPVLIRGQVHEGDLIVANDDGTARGVAKADVTLAMAQKAVGTAWASSNDPGLKRVNVAVGIGLSGGGARDISSLKAENAQLKAEAEKQKQENVVIKAYLCAKDPKAAICK